MERAFAIISSMPPAFVGSDRRTLMGRPSLTRLNDSCVGFEMT
jgi:hypothetical protein